MNCTYLDRAVCLLVVGEIRHQYDTVVKEKTADGFWSSLKKAVGISTKDHNVEIATVAFLPQWEDVCFNTEATAAAGVSLEDALRQINQVVYWMKASKKLVQQVRTNSVCGCAFLHET